LSLIIAAFVRNGFSHTRSQCHNAGYLSAGLRNSRLIGIQCIRSQMLKASGVVYGIRCDI